MAQAKGVIGWREWLALPELGIDRIKAKVDTGARSSALHAYDIKRFRRRGVSMVRFKVHPIQRDWRTVVEAEAKLVDVRTVKSSSGVKTVRPVIGVSVVLGERTFPIELTLVRRDVMGFRMLLGRQAVRKRFLVDPGASFLGGRGEGGGIAAGPSRSRTKPKSKSKSKSKSKLKSESNSNVKSKSNSKSSSRSKSSSTVESTSRSKSTPRGLTRDPSKRDGTGSGGSE